LNSGDFDRVVNIVIEENPVIATAEQETRSGRFKPLHISGTTGLGFPATKSQQSAVERIRRSFPEAELAQHILVPDTFATSERSTRPFQCGRCFGCNFIVLCLRQGSSQRFHHYLEQTSHGVQLGARKHVEQSVSLLPFLIEIHFH
jgi:hypothetical protein